jgi:formate hydrogenlyase subunit 6/NADH:ubiquinone oxidoreductase subunit I
VSGYFSDLVRGAASLAAGFAVTMKALLSPTVTVPYPRRAVPLPPGYRGPLELVRDPQCGDFVCIACGACCRACPSQCLAVTGEKREGRRGRYPVRFGYDFTRCSLCGTCVEICPVGALRFSGACGMAGFTPDEFRVDLTLRAREAP